MRCRCRISSAVEDYAKAIYALEQRATARRLDQRAGRAAGRHRRVGVGDGQEARRARARHARALPRRRADARGRRRSRSRSCATTGCSSSTWPRTLGVPWDRVHDEAEVLEHVLSEELEELIAAKLGNPTHDPHGDPIPTRDGSTSTRRRPRRWTSSSAGARGTLRARLGLRPRDAALPRRARHRARRRLRGRSTSSRSTARCSCASATRSTCSAARSRAAMRVEERARPDATPAPPHRDAVAPPSLERAPARPRARRGCAAGCACSARRSSRASPTSTRATSPPTSPAARSTATCCCG